MYVYLSHSEVNGVGKNDSEFCIKGEFVMAIFRCPGCEKYVFPRLGNKKATCPSCLAVNKIVWVEKRLWYEKFEIGRAQLKDKDGVTTMPVCMDLKTLTLLEEQ